MSKLVKIILGVVLAFAVVLWVGTWWVTSAPPPARNTVLPPPSLPEPRVLAPAASPVAAVPAPRALAPFALSSLPVPLESGGARDQSHLLEPQTEPSPAPLPPPVKPNAQGVIDLSADRSTKAFSEALNQGYRRRLEQERQNSMSPTTGN